jgi:hypothetical protein
MPGHKNTSFCTVDNTETLTFTNNQGCEWDGDQCIILTPCHESYTSSSCSVLCFWDGYDFVLKEYIN